MCRDDHMNGQSKVISIVSPAAVKSWEQRSQQVLSAGAASSDFEAPSPPGLETIRRLSEIREG